MLDKGNGKARAKAVRVIHGLPSIAKPFTKHYYKSSIAFTRRHFSYGVAKKQFWYSSLLRGGIAKQDLL